MKIKKTAKSWLKEQKGFRTTWESPFLYKVKGRFHLLSERLTGYSKEKRIYKERQGYELDLKNPKSYTQKIVWKKINDRNPILPIVTDKYQVRGYVKAVLGKEEAEKILIPLLYVTDDPATIPFDTLPEEYIIKTNHTSGKNIIVGKGNSVDQEKIIKQLKEWMSRPWGFFNLEWSYRKIKPKILIEKLLRDEDGKIPKDYKFFIFHGKCWLVHVDHDRFSDHTRSVFDRDWNYLPVDLKFKRGPKVEKPKSYKRMLLLAEKLGKDFDHVRVDLYEVDNNIYFGELTHYHESGWGKIIPKSFDFELGSKWRLNSGYWRKSEYLGKFAPWVRRKIYGK